jgi:TonB family protein
MRIPASAAVLVVGAGILLGLSCTMCVNRTVAPTVMPVVTKSVEPDYPEPTRKENIEGTALLDMLVRRDGMVGDARVYQSSGSTELDAAAKKAARQFEFEPAEDAKGNPVTVWIRQPFSFRLATLYSDDKPAPETPEYMTAAVMPAIVTDVPAAVPDSVWKQGMDGAVRLHLWLRRDGTVATARVYVSSGWRVLDDAAVKAARTCVYTPARNAKGELVNIWLERVCRFTRPPD